MLGVMSERKSRGYGDGHVTIYGIAERSVARLTNSSLRSELGRLATSTQDDGLSVEGVGRWSAEVHEVEQLASRGGSLLAEIFRCNWIDLNSATGDRPLWSGMVTVGVPYNDYGYPVLIVHDEDYSRRGLPGELTVTRLRPLPAAN